MRILTSTLEVVDRLQFSPDGTRLYGAHTKYHYDEPHNRGIAVWDLNRHEQPPERLFADRYIGGYAINPNPSRLASNGGCLYVLMPKSQDDNLRNREYHYYDLTRHELQPFQANWINSFPFAVHASGEWFICASRVAGGLLQRWSQPVDGCPIIQWTKTLQTVRDIPHLAIAPDRLRVVTHQFNWSGGITHQLQIRDAATGEVRRIEPVPGRTVVQLLFSPDGTWFVMGAGPSFYVWDGELNQKPRKVIGQREHINHMAFHPSGRYLVTTNNDHSVKHYDTGGWKLATTYKWNIGKVLCIAFSPDGALAAAGSDTGQVVLWDVDV